LHEARTKNGWTIAAKSKTGDIISAKKVVYRDNFDAALHHFIDWYKNALPTDIQLQAAFIRKFDDLCRP
jgi:hypothetical protein